jgi:hypothetical protein
MAKRGRKKGKKSGKKKAKGHVPLPILERRLKKLGKIVSGRGSDLYVAKD